MTDPVIVNDLSVLETYAGKDRTYIDSAWHDIEPDLLRLIQDLVTAYPIIFRPYAEGTRTFGPMGYWWSFEDEDKDVKNVTDPFTDPTLPVCGCFIGESALAVLLATGGTESPYWEDYRPEQSDPSRIVEQALNEHFQRYYEAYGTRSIWQIGVNMSGIASIAADFELDDDYDSDKPHPYINALLRKCFMDAYASLPPAGEMATP